MERARALGDQCGGAVWPQRHVIADWAIDTTIALAPSLQVGLQKSLPNNPYSLKPSNSFWVQSHSSSRAALSCDTLVISPGQPTGS